MTDTLGTHNRKKLSAFASGLTRLPATWVIRIPWGEPVMKICKSASL